jgi:hypothetical protein
MADQEYFYSVDIDGVYTRGSALPPLKGVVQFQADTFQAQGKFFERGYQLESEEGLFIDDKERFVSEVFTTTKETNNDDAVPNRLSVLLHDATKSPYAGTGFENLSLSNIFFNQLIVHRTIVPQQGGRRYRKSRKASRKARKSRRTSRH